MRWDAHAEIDLAIFIAQYTERKPAPDGSVVVASLGEWGLALLADGQERLEALDGSDA